MKQITALLLLLAALACWPAIGDLPGAGPGGAPFDESKAYALRLGPEQTATHWEAEIAPEGVVSCYVQTDPLEDDGGSRGVGITSAGVTFWFAGRSPGTATVTMRHYLDFLNGMLDGETTFTLTVDDDLRVTRNDDA